jgi:glycosyltransferase involved in cell wall biosynthesis
MPVERAESAQLPLTPNADGPRLWVELDDVIRYFDTSSTPTGIARVQLEILPRLLAAYPDRVGICRIGSHSNDVRVIPPEALARLLDSASAGGRGGSSLAGRMQAIARYGRRKLQNLADEWLASPAAGRAFSRHVRAGDVLLALGASWTHAHFGRSVRALKTRHGLKFALLVHDILPVTHPDLVSPGHVPNFRRWLDDMMTTWDFVLTPSKSSAAALRTHLAALGRPIPPIWPVPFGFGFGTATIAAEPVEREPYVLFVSTVEIRKNHLLLYHVWQRLIDRHGAANVPRLLFAGKLGWKIEKLRRLLAASNFLDGRIRQVGDLTDSEMARAYADCRFTVFPSRCEGWGLPVSESLYYGRLCLASNATSIPEVGGPAVDYFDPDNEDEAFALIERALFEPGYVERREAWIKANFRLPSWEGTARFIVETLVGAPTAAQVGAALRATSETRGSGRGHELPGAPLALDA